MDQVDKNEDNTMPVSIRQATHRMNLDNGAML